MRGDQQADADGSEHHPAPAMIRCTATRVGKRLASARHASATSTTVSREGTAIQNWLVPANRRSLARNSVFRIAEAMRTSCEWRTVSRACSSWKVVSSARSANSPPNRARWAMPGSRAAIADAVR